MIAVVVIVVVVTMAMRQPFESVSSCVVDRIYFECENFGIFGIELSLFQAILFLFYAS